MKGIKCPDLNHLFPARLQEDGMCHLPGYYPFLNEDHLIAFFAFARDKRPQ